MNSRVRGESEGRVGERVKERKYYHFRNDNRVCLSVYCLSSPPGGAREASVF